MSTAPHKPNPSNVLPLEDDIDIIRHETNLPAIGFFSAHDPRTIVTRREIPVGSVDGIRAPGLVVLEAPPRLGVPTTACREKWYAFSDIFMDRLAKTGMVQNPIVISGPEFVKALGRSKHGELYKDIQTWGERMAQTSITSRGVIYRKSMKAFIDTTEHVFRKFSFIRPEGVGQQTIMCEITLEDWVLENMNSMYVIAEDLNAYRRLNRDIAKALFDQLHLWFYASEGQPIERSYTLICQRLGVLEHKFKSKIKESMGKSLDELISIGYLESWTLLEMKSKEGFKFGLVPGKELLHVLKLTKKKLLGAATTSETALEDNRTVSALVGLGVTRDKAVELSKLGTEDEMLGRLDYINSLIYQKRNSRDRVENPAGFAIKLLENGVVIPEHFTTTREREEKIAEQRRARELEQATMINRLAYDQWCDKLKEHAVARAYSNESLEAAAKAKLPGFLKEYPHMRRFSTSERLREAIRIIEREICSDLELPTFEQWSEMDDYKNVQVALF